MERVRCTYCGEIIGVYEPAHVTLGDARELSGSLLTLRPEIEQPGSTAVHGYCYRDLAKRSEDERAGWTGTPAPVLGSAQRGFGRAARVGRRVWGASGGWSARSLSSACESESAEVRICLATASSCETRGSLMR